MILATGGCPGCVRAGRARPQHRRRARTRPIRDHRRVVGDRRPARQLHRGSAGRRARPGVGRRRPVRPAEPVGHARARRPQRRRRHRRDERQHRAQCRRPGRAAHRVAERGVRRRHPQRRARIGPPLLARRLRRADGSRQRRHRRTDPARQQLDVVRHRRRERPDRRLGGVRPRRHRRHPHPERSAGRRRAVAGARPHDGRLDRARGPVAARGRHEPGPLRVAERDPPRRLPAQLRGRPADIHISFPWGPSKSACRSCARIQMFSMPDDWEARDDERPCTGRDGGPRAGPQLRPARRVRPRASTRSGPRTATSRRSRPAGDDVVDHVVGRGVRAAGGRREDDARLGEARTRPQPELRHRRSGRRRDHAARERPRCTAREPRIGSGDPHRRQEQLLLRVPAGAADDVQGPGPAGRPHRRRRRTAVSGEEPADRRNILRLRERHRQRPRRVPTERRLRGIRHVGSAVPERLQAHRARDGGRVRSR